MITRREYLLTVAASLGGRAVSRSFLGELFSSSTESAFADKIAQIEKTTGGRLGVAMFDTATGAKAGHRANERFPMCSTFKFLAVSAVLTRVDQGKEQLDRVARFSEKDLIAYSPATEKRAGAQGMTVEELCIATVTLSDNTAANLLLASIGGPPGLTAFVRTLGDDVTRLDRIEPDLNEALPGDPRDTTTPTAIVSDLNNLVLGGALAAESRAKLTQ